MNADNFRIHPLLSLRGKLTGILLLASLATALAVGGTAYWMLLQDFNATVRENAFVYFEADVKAYIGAYGSWDNAHRKEAFAAFMLRRQEARERRMPAPDSKKITPAQEETIESDATASGR